LRGRSQCQKKGDYYDITDDLPQSTSY
jgi:hypothetical protein